MPCTAVSPDSALVRRGAGSHVAAHRFIAACLRSRRTTMIKLISIFRETLLAGALTCLAVPAVGNGITDWDNKAVAIVPPAPLGQRELAMVHVAMFDAVNSIERRYRPYLVQLTAPKTTSQEAAAATAAATVLVGLRPEAAEGTKAALATHLARIADGEAKLDGIKLGEAVAARILQVRANDG